MWTLGNGVERNTAHPESFEIPEEWKRNSLDVGSVVKLMFLTDDDNNIGGERMWVKVIENTAGNYIGVLDSEPAFIEGLELGDKIAFGPEHIINIWE